MSEPSNASTREEWLNSAVLELRSLFMEQGYPLPDRIRVSCGFPKGGRGQHSIGQCWSFECSADETAEIFVSPELDEVEGAQGVLSVLVHELVHAAVGVDEGHRGAFKHAALAVGLEGRMTATLAGEGLQQHLAVLAATLGPYPHRALTPKKGVKKQSTRLLKAVCPDCGYTIRVTRQWVDDPGPPFCPCFPEQMVQMVVEEPAPKEDD